MDYTGEPLFDPEKLEVYQAALDFVAWLTPLLEELSRAGDVKEQLDRASTSIPLNIAEGNGKYSKRDRCRYFDTATGSSLECASALDVLVAKGKLTVEETNPGKQRLARMVRMLIGLIRSQSDRNYGRRSSQG